MRRRAADAKRSDLPIYPRRGDGGLGVCFKGSWTRHVGTDGGRTLHWAGQGRADCGGTPTIDKHHAVTSTMGERFVLFRLPEVDTDEQARRSFAHSGRESEMRAELSAAVGALLSAGPPSQAQR